MREEETKAAVYFVRSRMGTVYETFMNAEAARKFIRDMRGTQAGNTEILLRKEDSLYPFCRASAEEIAKMLDMSIDKARIERFENRSMREEARRFSGMALYPRGDKAPSADRTRLRNKFFRSLESGKIEIWHEGKCHWCEAPLTMSSWMQVNGGAFQAIDGAAEKLVGPPARGHLIPGAVPEYVCPTCYEGFANTTPLDEPNAIT